MENPTWLSLLPPLAAILFAILTKQVFLSLFFGIWLGWTILAGGNPIIGLRDSIQGCVDVFKDAGNTRVIAFSAMVGALIAFTQRSGGVLGFINLVTERGYVKSRRGAQVLAGLLGVGIFIESSITCLVTGSVVRPLFDRFRISREKLAYICDSTSAPICILIPLNAWGAYIIGLLDSQQADNSLQILIYAMPLNFYAILAVLYVFVVILTGKDWGPMAKAERRAFETGKVLRDGAESLVSTEVLALHTKENVNPQARNMLGPIVAMVVMMPIGLLITGNGNLTEGSGSTAVLWSVLWSLVVAGVMYLAQKIFSLSELTALFFKGFGGLMPLAILMMFAFAIGAVCAELNTGLYVATVTKGVVNPILIPAILFLASAFIAFSTGTSWGTFAIMIPIGMPMITMLGAHQSLTIAAILAGGIFGDHCSPISDTTIISSMASGSDHIDHVNTQLPYAMLIGLISLILYLLVGFSLGV